MPAKKKTSRGKKKTSARKGSKKKTTRKKSSKGKKTKKSTKTQKAKLRMTPIPMPAAAPPDSTLIIAKGIPRSAKIKGAKGKAILL